MNNREKIEIKTEYVNGKKVNYVEMPIYTKQQQDNDEKKFSKNLENGKVDWSSFSRLMTNDLCVNTNILNDNTIGTIHLRDIKMALQNPKYYWKILLDLSDYLMHSSPHYYRLNNVYSNMAKFCWWIDLHSVDPDLNDKGLLNVKKVYSNLANKFENMNIEHEFSKIIKILPYKDCYCGLVVEDNNSFYFQEVPHNVYKISQTQDGLFNFSINLSCIKDKYLNYYPDYVQQAYLNYINNLDNNKSIVSEWYTPPSDKQICLKFNSQWSYPYPMLINLIRDILDLDTYKKLKLQSARTDNYKAIMVKVPIDEKAVDKPLLTPETLAIFAEINRESMSDDIALIHTLGSAGEAISFKDSSNTRNNVSDAIDEIYNSSGTSKELFNGSASGTAVTFSVENDSGFIYGVYRQIERWMNRYIKIHKYNKTKFKFKFYLLDITIYNNDNITKKYKEACTLGATVVDKWLASLGMTPSRTLGSFVLHKDVFNFADNFIPLQTSYTTSSNESGRPTNASKGEVLDVEGEATADGDKNNL